MSLNFDLPAFDVTLGLDASMELDESSAAYNRLASRDATVVIEVGTTAMKSTFKFLTDASDVDDVIADDTKYYVDAGEFPKINVAHAMIDHGSADAPIVAGYAANRSLMKHDFMRYLSQELFNTPQGLDLVSNETAVSQDIATNGSELFVTDISAALAAAGTEASPLTNSTTTQANLVRELLRHVAATAPTRLSDILNADSADNNENRNAIPFLENDTINFHVTVNAAANQNNLTGVGAIAPRTYRVMLLVRDTPSNTPTATLTDTPAGLVADYN